jgi:predicted nuclease of predicted toxin-antitoxin system
MRILIDECVDWRILRDLTDYEAKTVKQLGWENVDDGELLSLGAREFDVLLTVDKDLPREQNIANFDIAVVVLRGRTTRLLDLRQLLVPLHAALRRARPGEFKILNWRDGY